MALYRLRVIVCLLVFLLATAARAELPASRVLPEDDQRKFKADMAEIEQFRATAADRPAMDFLKARNLAAWKQWPEAIQWLQRVADATAGFDPASDPLFKDLRQTPEFKAILRQMEAATPPARL